VAECTDSSTALLQELNPSLLRMTTPKDMDFDLHLPQGTAAKFETAVAAIPQEMRVYWRYHLVQSGETLSEIARRYHTTASAIAEANNLEGTDLALDSKLIIPVSPSKAAAEPSGHAAVVGFSKHPSHYTVRKGDTVLSVADDFGVPAEKLRQWNHLKGNVLRPGHSLTIFKPSSAPAVLHPASAAASRTRLRTGVSHPGVAHPAARTRTHPSAEASSKSRQPSAANSKHKAAASSASKKKRRQQD
jgi:membrane-bound lytic murein transglycosylase D